MVKHVPSLLNDGCQLIRAPFPLLKLLKPSPTLIHFIKSYKIDQDYGPWFLDLFVQCYMFRLMAQESSKSLCLTTRLAHFILLLLAKMEIHPPPLSRRISIVKQLNMMMQHQILKC